MIFRSVQKLDFSGYLEKSKQLGSKAPSMWEGRTCGKNTKNFGPKKLRELRVEEKPAASYLEEDVRTRTTMSTNEDLVIPAYSDVKGENHFPEGTKPDTVERGA